MSLEVSERTVGIQMSDEDAEKLSALAAKHGMTAGELLSSFAGDLICGSQTNGADERDFARLWLNRRYGYWEDDSLLAHLADSDPDVNAAIDEFLRICGWIQRWCSLCRKSQGWELLLTYP